MRARRGSKRSTRTLALSPALSIADNMFLGRELRSQGVFGRLLRSLDRAAMQKFARDKLNELGLMTIQNISQPVETLSGGQRQGVAVARAAAFARRVIIMDEPTAALGVKESRRVLELILDFQEAAPAIHPDFPQHAACLRIGRPHPHSPPRPATDRDRPQEADDVRCGRDDDGGDGRRRSSKPRKSRRPPIPPNARMTPPWRRALLRSVALPAPF